MEKYLSYDDVLLKPVKTQVTNLEDVETAEKLCSNKLELPVISAPMDTVTETEMCISLDKNGGLGVVHRFNSISEQCEIVEEVSSEKCLVGGAIGLNDFKRAEKLVESGLDYLVLDIAHGHHEKLLENVNKLKQSFKKVDLIAGNVATVKGAKDIEKAGADAVKVGIGPGSACTTREMTGAGVPQFSAVQKCSKAVKIPVIADGGIRKPGDLVKALMAGASAGMIGGMLSGTKEAPGRIISEDEEKYKVFRGMSSSEAGKDRAEKQNEDENYEDRVPEGINTKIKYKGSVERVLHKLRGGLRSGISYCGAENLQSARENSSFVQVTNSTQFRNGSHIKK